MNNTQPQLDPSIVNMTKAIGQVESGGDYSAVGKSKEYGAYQYTPDTWTTDSQKYLGQSVPLETTTPAQQDEVAYKKVEDLGKQGYKPDQIASIWNSGKPDYEGNVGTNKYGVNYDTPDYVNKVGKAYDAISNGQAIPQDSNTASTVKQDTQPQDGLIKQFAVGMGSSIINTAKFIGDFLGLKPTPFGEKLLSSSQNLDQGTAKDVGQFAGEALQTSAALGTGTGLLEGIFGKSTALSSPIIKGLIMDDLGPEETLGSINPSDKINILTNALRTGSMEDAPLIRKAIQELSPDIFEEATKKAGLLSKVGGFLKTNPLGWYIDTQLFGEGKKLIRDVYDKYVGSQISGVNPSNTTTINPAP